ncbi:DUF4358 domain-containing protein [Paenibacillus oryzisoli]|uniref:DUF4358 domain-containing protein n=1 Tax=Paenibacillus oryzisoli TaxID=1850517 RepID=UPI003D2AE848
MKQRRIIALAIAVGILSGCSERGGASETLTALEVSEHIQQTAKLSEMQQRDAKDLQKLYHIEAGDVEDFVLYTALSNVQADELAVIKVKDTSETENVMNQIRQRIKTQTVKFKDYRPVEYDLIEKNVLKSKGRFVFFAVSRDVDQMDRAFEEAVK